MRAGLFGSMPTSQVVVLVVGGGLSFVGILLRLFPWALLPALVAAVLAFKRVGWVAAARADPVEGARGSRRRRGTALVPAGSAADAGDGQSRRLPPTMRGLRLLDVDAGWVASPGRLAGVGVVHDTTAGLLTAVLRVTGDGQFSLTSAAVAGRPCGPVG